MVAWSMEKKVSEEIQTLRRIYARVLRTTGTLVIKTCYSGVLKGFTKYIFKINSNYSPHSEKQA